MINENLIQCSDGSILIAVDVDDLPGMICDQCAAKGTPYCCPHMANARTTASCMSDERRDGRSICWIREEPEEPRDPNPL